MKKLLASLSVVVMTVIFCLFPHAFANVAYAQGAYYEVKESQFVAGVWGTNNDGDEIVIALYDNGSQDIAYITNGIVSFYDTYTVTPTSVTGASEAERFNIGEIAFTYCEVCGGRYILTDDGDIYSVTDITAYEVEQIRK